MLNKEIKAKTNKIIQDLVDEINNVVGNHMYLSSGWMSDTDRPVNNK